MRHFFESLAEKQQFYAVLYELLKECSGPVLYLDHHETTEGNVPLSEKRGFRGIPITEK